jgi:tetratricopeptide (TPR) repeat protein
MKSSKILVPAITAFLLLSLPLWSNLARGQASRPANQAEKAQQLNELLAELQESGACHVESCKENEQNLRQQIIQLALTIHPAPPIPSGAHDHFVKGGAFYQNAQEAADALSAVNEFQQAVDAAPWWPQAYYNLGAAYEKLGKMNPRADSFDLAGEEYRLYLASNPTDASAVRDRILALDAEKQIAARAATEEAQKQQEAAQRQQQLAQQQQEIEQEKVRLAQEQAQAQKPQSDEEFIQSLNGARYTHPIGSGSYYDLTIRGNQLVHETFISNSGSMGKSVYQIEGRTAEIAASPRHCDGVFGTADCKQVYTIRQENIEMDWYVGGEKLEPPFIRSGEDCAPQVYDRVQ